MRRLCFLIILLLGVLPSTAHAQYLTTSHMRYITRQIGSDDVREGFAQSYRVQRCRRISRIRVRCQLHEHADGITTFIYQPGSPANQATWIVDGKLKRMGVFVRQLGPKTGLPTEPSAWFS